MSKQTDSVMRKTDEAVGLGVTGHPGGPPPGTVMTGCDATQEQGGGWTRRAAVVSMIACIFYSCVHRRSLNLKGTSDVRRQKKIIVLMMACC